MHAFVRCEKSMHFRLRFCSCKFMNSPTNQPGEKPVDKIQTSLLTFALVQSQKCIFAAHVGQVINHTSGEKLKMNAGLKGPGNYHMEKCDIGFDCCETWDAEENRRRNRFFSRLKIVFWWLAIKAHKRVDKIAKCIHNFTEPTNDAINNWKIRHSLLLENALFSCSKRLSTVQQYLLILTIIYEVITIYSLTETEH